MFNTRSGKEAEDEEETIVENSAFRKMYPPLLMEVKGKKKRKRRDL